MTLPRPYTTEAEYLAYDLANEGRHEYYGGEIVAMSGASEAHVLVSMNLAALFVGRLRGTGCRAYNADMRVQLADTDAYVYPDLSVVCGPPDFADTNPVSLRNPVLVVEVLSDSTEAHDRGAKAAHYRHLRGLAAYVLVATRTRRVEVYARQDDGSWRLTEAEGDGAVDLPHLGFALALPEVYEGVAFPPRPERPTT